ncbi:MAG: alpha-L-fucosidase [Halobacteriaceae archaeon]
MPTYEENWRSLEQHPIPRWFKDAAFGVYFHWGPYSVPAHDNEWYSRNMYDEDTDVFDYHRETYGDQSEFGYKDFLPEFDAAEWDPEAWVDRCVDAGAEFVGVTAVHADGFCMWDSDVTEWNAAEKGPERDVLGELAAAVRDRDLKFVASVHHACHWWWYPHEEGWDTADPAYEGLYGPAHERGEQPPESYYERWRDLTFEVIDDYRPDLLYFDWGWGNDWFVGHDEYRREVVAHYYNRAEEWGKEVDICQKTNVQPGVGVVDYERTRADDVAHHAWLTDTPVDLESWGYVEDPDFKSADTLVTGLVDRVSKNGRTMLNIGPRPDGTIPEPAAERLRAIGEWMDTNAEGLRDTRPWWTFGEGPTEVTSTEYEDASLVSYTPEDVRFTRTDDAVYVFFLAWPEGPVTIETPAGRRLSAFAGEWSLGPDPEPWGEATRVELLGSDAAVDWDATEEGLVVDLPDERPCRYAYGLRIELD